jgi:hypothetical protein
VYVRGATPFDDLKTVDGEICATFRDACVIRGLLIDDNHVNQTMREAAEAQMPQQLRNLFAIILLYSTPANPLLLWNTYKHDLCEDILHRRKEQQNDNLLELAECNEDECLLLINDILRRDEKSLSDFNLRQPIQRNVNRYIQQEMYNMCDMQEYVNENYSKATAEQQNIYNTIVDATRTVKNQNGTSDHHNIFFLDAYAGTGKTWTINMILAGVRAEGTIALATASSGIAALLLSGGSTSYSTFKIPLNVTENSTCNVSKHKDIADMLRNSSLIIWDEVTLSHKHAIEAVDRLLRDHK